MKLTPKRIEQATKLGCAGTGGRPKRNRKQSRFYQKTLALQIAAEIRRELSGGA